MKKMKMIGGYKMKIYEQQYFNAFGGKREYRHKQGKENVQTTRLQNFLDEFRKRNSNIKLNMQDYRGAK